MAKLLYADTSTIEGIGCFAGVDLPQGTMIPMEGILVPYEDKYCLEYDHEYYFRPMIPFNYLNHSEEPNIQVFVDEESGSYYLETLYDIETGEELTFHYGEGTSFE